MTNIHAVLMLISAVLCTVLALISALFRTRRHINRAFTLLAMTLALDSAAYFVMFQFGATLSNLKFWMRVTAGIGFLVPISILLFVFAFTGYARRMRAKVLGVRAVYFFRTVLPLLILFLLVSLFTDLIVVVPEDPQNMQDMGLGPLGGLMWPVFAVIFAYMFAMTVIGLRKATTPSDRHFIRLLSIGTFLWVAAGYGGAAIFPGMSEAWHATYYTGTSVMAVLFFIAIVNYQADNLMELNLGLERKVEERTLHLREAQAQLVQSEKMATLGHLVAGVAHEMNTPVGAVYSTHHTLSSAANKLSQTLKEEHGIDAEESRRIGAILRVLSDVSDVIRTSGERISAVVKRLKLFAQLDEAELQRVDFNECVESALAMFEFHLKPGVAVRRELGALPEITCYPAKINQLCFQLLSNANRAIEATGDITLRTETGDGTLRFSVTDTGRGIPRSELGTIFDPGYTAWDLHVGAGLGLAICYQVARVHSGRIDVESEAGRGSTFTVTIPLTGPSGTSA